MIRFIGIGNQIGDCDEDSNDREFAFYDTVTDKFATAPNGGQCWTNIQEFKDEFEDYGEVDSDTFKELEKKSDIEKRNYFAQLVFRDRCLLLIPRDFFPGNKMDECACGGDMLSTGKRGESKCVKCRYILQE